MKKAEKQMIVATIYNRNTKTKAELREEGEKALKKFLKSGGAIETVKAKKTPKSKMSTKTSRGFCGGTSGFATGMPRRSTFTLV